MKKSTMTMIVLGMVLALGAFWGYLKFSTSQEQSIQTQDNETDEEVTQDSLDEMKIVQETQEEKTEKRSPTTVQTKSLGEVIVSTPAYELTGTVPTGTTRINVTWKNEQTNRTLSYDLNKFKAGDKEFLTRMRIDYGNIDKGENTYTIEFFTQEETQKKIAIATFTIKSYHDTIKIGNSNLYFRRDNYHPLPVMSNGELQYIQIFANDPLQRQSVMKSYAGGVLIETNGIYRVTYNPIIINEEKKWAMEIKNPQKVANRHLAIPAIKGDLYTLDGTLIASQVPYLGFSTGGEYGIELEYHPQKHYLSYSHADGDACRSYTQISFIDLKKDEEVFSLKKEGDTIALISDQNKWVIETRSEPKEDFTKVTIRDVTSKYYKRTNTQDYSLVNEKILYTINKEKSVNGDGCSEPINRFTNDLQFENQVLKVEDHYATIKRNLTDLFNPTITLK